MDWCLECLLELREFEPAENPVCRAGNWFHHRHGAAVAVCLYGALGFFGPSLLSQTFLSYQKPIVFAGAILAAAIGVLRLYDFLKPERPAERTDCKKVMLALRGTK